MEKRDYCGIQTELKQNNLKKTVNLTGGNVAELLTNKLGLKVLTDTGFSDFDGLLIKSIKELLHIKLSKTEIKCTHDHKVFLYDLSNKEAKDLKLGDKIYTSYGIDIIVEITKIPEEQTYDVFNVKNNHRFYANEVLVKNCEFLVYDETLINSICLSELEGSDPILKMGQTRWYKKPQEDMFYVVGLDPAMGTGGNSAAIQVVELPTMIQVAEWHHNTTPIEDQVRILKSICKYISECCPRQNGSNIYWSVENNSVGEAALIVIKNVGEENIPGLLVSEPIRKGHVRKFRKGFNTTHNSKIAACSRLKHIVESKKLKINSKAFISELKAFIAKGISFEAKPGEDDDLVSAMLLCVRMCAVLADWHSNIYDVINGKLENDEDYELPMPIYISRSL